GNRVFVSRERKELIVSLADKYKTDEIANICHVSSRTVQRVLELWRKHGDVVREPLQAGRPRELDYLDLAYLEACVERTPDVYIYELKDQLMNARGVDVSECTISRSL
ncbi:hypothetical protein FIBSPDRAFT_667968, partial [Athelia psychrophila]